MDSTKQVLFELVEQLGELFESETSYDIENPATTFFGINDYSSDSSSSSTSMDQPNQVGFSCANDESEDLAF